MNSTLTRVAARVTGLVAVAAVLAACGSVQERVEETITREVVDKALGEDVDLREDGLTVTTEDGTLDMSTGGDLPDDWPSALPIPRDGKVATASSRVGPDGTEMNVIVQLEGDFDTVQAEIEDGIAGTAWTPNDETYTASMEGMRVWNQGYVAGDVTAHVSMMMEDGTITIIWLVEEPAA